MKRTLIQKNTTSIVKGLIEQVESLSAVDHRLTNGQLKELFVSNILRSFLPSQYSIGSGIIINKEGDQSNQTDIVIYDNRFLVPFINQQNIGVYPVESVLATVEVKSKLNKTGKDGLKEIDRKAIRLYEINKKSLLTETKFPKSKHPYCAAVGFNKVVVLAKGNARDWLEHNLKIIGAICFINCCCWMKMEDKGWDIQNLDEETNEETKRFIAVLLDNIWRRGEERFKRLTSDINKDMLSCYIRR